MSMNKKIRQSYQRTPDIRWKPNVGENHLLQFVSFFFNEKLLLQYTGAVLYQYAGYNLQRATTLSLVFQLLLEGSYNPL